MNTSFDEFRSRLRELPQAASRINELRAIAQETVRVTALTGTPEWDHFLAYLEARIKANELAIEAELRKLASPVLVDPQAIILAKLALAAMEASTQTLREVIMLPK